ncbi:MAG: hypothetical protein ACLRQ4_22925 [Neglectibacter timonensis]
MPEGTEGRPAITSTGRGCYTFVINCVRHGALPGGGRAGTCCRSVRCGSSRADSCTHVCSERLYQKELNCRRHKVNGGEAGREDGLGRNSECGYTPATGGTPCTYVCPICPVQAQINALPTADELGNMTEEEQQAVYEKLQAAYDAYNALTDEQKEEIAGAEIFDSCLTRSTAW